MIYMTPTTTGMDWLSDRWGVIRTPSSYKTMVGDRIWCVDNEAYTGKFTWERLLRFLISMEEWKESCLFVSVPDVVGDCIATMDRYRYWAWRIKAMGWRVAFVAQDGQEQHELPPEYDTLFIGGSTEWKLSKSADRCIKRAQKEGKWIHVGRVNSLKRIRHFQLIGVDSVDRTHPAYAPDETYKRFDKQLNQMTLITLD